MTREQYWAANSPTYPHAAIQHDNITADFTTPEQLTTRRLGNFIRVPFLDATPPHVLWGFETAQARDQFIADFGGAVYVEGVAP